jgi:hypothetical protein
LRNHPEQRRDASDRLRNQPDRLRDGSEQLRNSSDQRSGRRKHRRSTPGQLAIAPNVGAANR